MKNVPIQNAISFAKFNIIKCDFTAPFDIKQDELRDISVKLKFSTGFNEKESNNFAVRFVVDLGLATNSNFNVYVYAHCEFKTSEAITEDFKSSDFVKLNAPAIAFPFLRSFIQTLCVNAGIPPIILPSFNFTNVVECEEEID